MNSVVHIAIQTACKISKSRMTCTHMQKLNRKLLKMINKYYVKIDEWVKEIIVDPLSKEPLSSSEDGTFLISPYGRKYPIIEGIYDLRLLSNQTTYDQKRWKVAQLSYEKNHFCNLKQPVNQNYTAEFNGVRDVYKEIPIEGDCLDVGGHQGRLRAFLSPDQKYISCDTFLHVFDQINRQPNLTKVYPFLLEPVNFLSCDAEFLPFKSCSFQTVHMRSVIDHFLNPELALNESYRCLKDNGSLVVGLYVHGGKHGKVHFKAHVKEAIRSILPYLGIHKYTDHHVWHPTYKELIELISMCGFKVDKVHWQKGYNETVCYIKALKENGLRRRT